MKPGLIPLEGPKTYKETYNNITLNGALNKTHLSFEESTSKLLRHSDQFRLTGDGFETRYGKFKNTIKTFYDASGAVGATAGTVVMVPVDLLVGRGGAEPGKKGAFVDEGVLGFGTQIVGGLTAGGAQLIGEGVGVAAAAVTYPAKDTQESSKGWLKKGAILGGNGFGRGAAYVLGTSFGLAADAVRVPSLIVKFVLKGGSAVLSLPVGFLAGSIRAIANK